MGRIGVRLLASMLLASLLSGCFLSPEGANSRSASGDWAREFLSGDEYGELLVEIHHAPDAAPADSAVALLKTRLAAHLDKPDGIDVRLIGDLPSKKGEKLTLKAIDAMEKEHRDSYKSGKRAVLYVGYLDSGYEADAGNQYVLGAAYHGSSAVIFKENVKKSVQGSLLPGVTGATAADVEEAVLIHEVGHLLGLVNNGIPMQEPHEDPAHPSHSANSRSVMYYKVETSDVVSYIQNGFSIPKDFDAQDKADMRAAEGK